MEFTVKGKTVFAATGGRPFDPSRPAVVFIHGSGMDHTVWALQTRYFAYRDRSVLAIDLPGHGRSKGTALSTIEKMAGWLNAALDALGLEQAALAGHSMGSLVALQCAASHPKRVAKLALLGVASTMPVHPDLLAAAKDNDHLAFDLIVSWAHGRTGHLGGIRAPGLWLMGGGERLLERTRAGVLHRDLAACNAYGAAVTQASKIGVPSLLVLGDQDRMTPAKSGRKLAEMIPDARVEVIADCGHMMMTEKPDQTLDALKSFL